MNTMLLNSCIVARVFFAFVKDGEPAQELKDKVGETGLQKRFVFTGFIKDLRTLYADMGILLLTSINEGTPVAIIEGVANRVPVFSSRVGRVPNLIEDGHSGWLFEPSDIEGFAGKISEVLAAPAASQEITSRPWQAISAKYSAARLKQELEALFEELMK